MAQPNSQYDIRYLAPPNAYPATYSTHHYPAPLFTPSRPPAISFSEGVPHPSYQQTQPWPQHRAAPPPQFQLQFPPQTSITSHPQHGFNHYHTFAAQPQPTPSPLRTPLANVQPDPTPTKRQRAVTNTSGQPRKRTRKTKENNPSQSRTTTTSSVQPASGAGPFVGPSSIGPALVPPAFTKFKSALPSDKRDTKGAPDVWYFIKRAASKTKPDVDLYQSEEPLMKQPKPTENCRLLACRLCRYV